MSKKAKIEEIENFLEEFRQIMKTFGFQLIERYDEAKTQVDVLVGTPLNAESIIMNNLNYTHYNKGPERDHYFEDNNVWFFGYEEHGKMIYIKLSDHYGDKPHKLAKCLSFHEAEFDMDLPYKDIKGEK